jgi:hypothetical protein
LKPPLHELNVPLVRRKTWGADEGGAVEESKRIKAFRHSTAKDIPKFPNDKATLTVLEQKPLASLLIDYANWAIRYIAPRPRAVLIEQMASNDPRWKVHEAEIQVLLNKRLFEKSLIRRFRDPAPRLNFCQELCQMKRPLRNVIEGAWAKARNRSYGMSAILGHQLYFKKTSEAPFSPFCVTLRLLNEGGVLESL